MSDWEEHRASGVLGIFPTPFFFNLEGSIMSVFIS